MARGKDGTSCCKGEPNPDQVKMYVYPGFINAAAYSSNNTYPAPQKIPVTNGVYPPGVSPGTQTVGHAFAYYELPLEIRYYRHVNKGYLEWATSVSLMPYPKPVIIPIYSEIIMKFILAAYGLWKGMNATSTTCTRRPATRHTYSLPRRMHHHQAIGGVATWPK
ncbi:hypothetical protein [Vulcanisaeta sp. JCM 16161]|uniref:hypothetical protein n=1 Tax=Vulcanisaeta sp. JCM 16161 TaxID=1295372 RepID=UPI001FB2CA8B|nr:hypothetical protein [Vulcanisaeta sp. JCM 16161]